MMTRFSEMINTWLGWCPNVQMFQNVQTNTTIPPAPVQNEPPGGGDARSWRAYRRGRRGMRSLIPAGLLIGLGVGLLVGHIVAAGLIGLGLGFLVSAVANAISGTDGDAVSPDHAKTWMKEHGYNEDMSEVAAKRMASSNKHGFGLAFIGIFFIVFGIMIVWAPVLLWPYIGAAFLILLGIGILVHGFLHHGDYWH
jgi:hypothetical protein